MWDELNASFEDYEDNQGDNIEEINMEQTVGVSHGGIFETVVNLKEWMKQPWSTSEDLWIVNNMYIVWMLL